MERIRQLTPRQWGGALDSCIAHVNAWLRGWHQFFGISSASEQYTMRALDAHIRRRLRAIVLHHWKRRRTIVRNLIALRVNRRAAWRGVYQGHRSLWALSHIPAVDHGLRNAFFAKRGLVPLAELHRPRAPGRRRPRPATTGAGAGDDSRSQNRPATGVITRRPEEPYTNSVRTVLWEPGAGNCPWLPDSEPRSGALDGRAERSYHPVRAASRRRDSPTIIHGEPVWGRLSLWAAARFSRAATPTRPNSGSARGLAVKVGPAPGSRSPRRLAALS